MSGLIDLESRNVDVEVSQLLGELIPPREFEEARFSNYQPDARFPSQAVALNQAQEFTHGLVRARRSVNLSGIYLDGGFGVGKTHLLASVWHASKGRKAYGSFLNFTSLIGLLGFQEALLQLKSFDLVCIDEFELDDPGDTMLMSRILNELEKSGTKFAATSNTPPSALGEGRFAAADFQREIQGISDRFLIVSIDGEDYRHRPIDAHSSVFTEVELQDWLLNQQARMTVAAIDFEKLIRLLGQVHPSKFGRLIEGVRGFGIGEVFQLTSQVDALRFVSLVDRLYEQQVQIRNTGIPATDVFSEEMLSGGYRKKYLRAISRLGSMTS